MCFVWNNYVDISLYVAKIESQNEDNLLNVTICQVGPLNATIYGIGPLNVTVCGGGPLWSWTSLNVIFLWSLWCFYVTTWRHCFWLTSLFANIWRQNLGLWHGCGAARDWSDPAMTTRGSLDPVNKNKFLRDWRSWHLFYLRIIFRMLLRMDLSFVNLFLFFFLYSGSISLIFMWIYKDWKVCLKFFFLLFWEMVLSLLLVVLIILQLWSLSSFTVFWF
jgi:hypothetical protein